ncbi:MAG: hypothetical protein JXR69_04985 [Candidatus Delongbacteria bacterium]|nr:hypothetical protein [Candidatus Delongbacteria bacterium]
MEKLERIFFINRELKKHDRVKLDKLALSMDVDKETVVDDIRYMNDKLKANINFAKTDNTFCYNDKFDFGEKVDEKWVPFYRFVKNIFSNQSLLPSLTEETVNRWMYEINKTNNKNSKAV